MKNKFPIIIKFTITIILFFTSFIYAHTVEELDRYNQKLRKLKARYQITQSELNKVTEKRWCSREANIQKKKTLSETLERVQNSTKMLITENYRKENELFNKKEELIIDESGTESFRKEREFLYSALKEEFEDRRNRNYNSFPINREERMVFYNNILDSIEDLKSLNRLLKIRNSLALLNFERYQKVAIEEERIVLGLDNPANAIVLNVGDALAYGITPDGKLLTIQSSSRNDKIEYKWVEISSAENRHELVALFPKWTEESFLKALMPVDVIRNSNSSKILSGEKASFVNKIVKTFNTGGVFMYPLLVLTVIALLLIVNKFFYYSIKHKESSDFIKKAVTLLENGDNDGALKLTENRRSSLASILKVTLKHKDWLRETAEKAVKEELLKEVPLLDKHLDSLAVIAAAAPLVGLLGTVSGMIKMFKSITEYGTQNPSILAGGISEALVTTEVGLIVAIPVMLLHTLLKNRRNIIKGELESFAVIILNRIWPES